MDSEPVHLLVVEDDDVDYKVLKRAFNKSRIGNPIHRVKNGREALAVLRGGPEAQPFTHRRIILLDLNMPVMNGIEFLRELRADKALTQDVVFALTTSKSDKDVFEAYRFGVAGYIVKSNVGDGFLALVRLLESYWTIVTLP